MPSVLELYFALSVSRHHSAQTLDNSDISCGHVSSCTFFLQAVRFSPASYHSAIAEYAWSSSCCTPLLLFDHSACSVACNETSMKYQKAWIHHKFDTAQSRTSFRIAATPTVDMTVTREISGLNLCQVIGYPDWGPSWFSSVVSEKCRDCIARLGYDHVLSSPFQFTDHNDTPFNAVLTTA